MSHSLAAGIHGCGTFVADLEAIQTHRRSTPSWAPSDTPGHFFKYSDEQTIVAAHALDNAIQTSGLTLDDCRDWGVIAAPQFVGRLAGANIFHRFAAKGDAGVTPHALPQYSLHSVSGALSILLATHGPNVGVGGGPGALADGLFAALSLFDLGQLPGVWLVATQWDAEPLPDRRGECATKPTCYGVAFGLRSAACSGAVGNFSLECDYDNLAKAQADNSPGRPSVIDLCGRLRGAAENPLPSLQWKLDWGARIQLHLTPAAVNHIAA